MTLPSRFAILLSIPAIATLGINGCSGSTSSDDAGSDASSDTTTTDAADGSSSTDSGSGSDASNDAPADVKQGGLDAGAACDPKNDQCGPGLKCCAGGVVVVDGGSNAHCLVETDAGTCPIVP